MADVSGNVRALQRDLSAIFGERLQSLIVYANEFRRSNAPVQTLAVVHGLTADDLSACAERLDDWHDSGLGTPLVLAAREFDRSLDAFPFEFGAILADHVVVAGEDPFDGLSVDPADLRRASERRARSHLLHLREGFLETRGRGDLLADLLARSAAPLEALVRSVARLQGASTVDAEGAARHVESSTHLTPGSLADVVKLSNGKTPSSEEARRIFPPYLDAIEALTNSIDRWGAARR